MTLLFVSTIGCGGTSFSRNPDGTCEKPQEGNYHIVFDLKGNTGCSAMEQILEGDQTITTDTIDSIKMIDNIDKNTCSLNADFYTFNAYLDEYHFIGKYFFYNSKHFKFVGKVSIEESCFADVDEDYQVKP